MRPSQQVQRIYIFVSNFIALVLLVVLMPGAASALSEATADSADRYPFVVEVKFHDQLICSGTVLYPRIVVTAAHCLQQKVYWRGGQFYVDEYLHSSDLNVSVTRDGATGSYEVADISVSPVWRGLASEPRSGQRFAHDLALIITKEPVAVDLPANLLRSAQDDTLDRGLVQYGVLVAFGVGSCASMAQCGQAGIRRYRPVAIEQSAECLKTFRGGLRPPQPAGGAEDAASFAVWCMEASVMPGDSGGALLVEDEHGQLYYRGVISAQQGSPELALIAPVKRSLATALHPSLEFILAEARKLGYAP